MKIRRQFARTFRTWRKSTHDEPVIHRSAVWWTKYYQQSVANLALVIWVAMAAVVGFQHCTDGLAGWSNDSPSRPCVFAIDINAVSWPELTCLPGIGEVLAKRIVDARSQHGPFSRCEDLLHVHGIGRKTVEKMRPFLRFDNTPYFDDKRPPSN